MAQTECVERDWPDPANVIGERAVEFTLQYEGVLPAASQKKPRKAAKRRIREELSFQLRQLWSQEPLKNIEEYDVVPLKGGQPSKSFVGVHYVAGFGGSHFLPVITRKNALVCHLDIKLLRDGNPGDLVRHGGDLDNQIKTLFDALRMPHSLDELGEPPKSEPTLYYCLLEDDALITKFSIEAQRRLKRRGEPEGYVSAQISVVVKATKITEENQAYLA